MPDDVTGWLAGRAVPIGSLESGSALTELAPLRDTLRGVRLVGLGEATHGSAEFFLLRWRLTEFLVKELGFTTFAIEASAAAARAVDAYTAGGPGDPREALAGLGFWTLNTAEMLTVLERLREHNRTAARPVRFVGIDPQYPGAALKALRACLGEAAAPLLDPLGVLDRTGLRQPWQPLDRQVEADARRLEEYVAEHGPAEAGEHARILRQYADVASRPFTHADPLQTLGIARDRYMAENVALLLADPEEKVAVWAHNGHVMKRSHSGGAVPAMGMHLAREFGQAYYALGALFGHGEFRAHRRRFGRLVRGRPPAVFRVPPVDTARHVAARLAAARPGDYLVDLRGGDRPEPVAAWLAETNHLRSFGGMAVRLTARFAFMPTVLADEFDGLALLRQVSRSTPL
ncbi:erythromycin esterase family protein [Nonomuraea rubra]|uniref:Erythromycin esterase n=1 Tax=Nonomuraea rubra TaxID=46180 RepID=A0A7X0TZS2_9ACTN|nr:erythromycin esterase family protein [Nonomuraea rubra]MBB6549871.1 erythromycin esterase [Nonomuraea rubra]